MAMITRRAGAVRLELPDDARVIDLAPGAPTVPPGRRRGQPLSTRPVPLPGGAPASAESDPVVASMQAQDMELFDAFAVEVPPPAPGTRRGSAATPSQVSVEVTEDENAVVLLETDGVYEWRFADPGRTAVTAPTRRGPVIEPTTKQLVFDLRASAVQTPAARRARGPIADFIGKKVRAYILKFVAGLAVQHGVKFLERKARRGLIVMDSDDVSKWRREEDMSALDLPADRPARILLFVHGTFSSTVGSFGALGASEWGRELLAAARRSYDLIIGYDHLTLGDDPLENATDLLARLERGQYGAPPQIDAVSYSRGALVLRSFIEYLLPSSQLGARVGRAVFVGGTNGGTQLAEPDNWARLADLYTNIALAASHVLDVLGTPVGGVVLRESIGTLGALIKYMAATAVTDRGVPGLAAMEPDGAFVTTLNTTQPGQPGPADSLYCVISSDFDVSAGEGAPELPARLRQWIVDAFVDSLMREPNDLVVNTSAMSAIDPGAGAFVKDTFAFGRNPHVYHTIYFTRPEVATAIARWLQLATPAVAAEPARAMSPGRELPAIADPSVQVASTDDSFAEVLNAAERSQARYVVLSRRERGMHYALRTDELASARERLNEEELRSTEFPVWEALDRTNFALHETAASREVSLGTAPSSLTIPPSGRTGVTARRTILFDGTLPRGVVEPPDAIPSTEALTQRAQRAAPPPPPAPPARRRGVTRAMPPAPATLAPPAAGGPSAGVPAPSAGAAAPPAHPEVSANFFFAANMPEAVPVKQTTQLFVTISRDEIERPAGAADVVDVLVDLEQKLTVQLIAKTNFKIVGDDRAVIDPAKKRRYQLVFEVEGTDVGQGELWVLIRQGAEALATLTLRPQIVAAIALGTRTVSATAEAAPTGGGRYPVLWITEKQNGNSYAYSFSLDLGDGSYIAGDSAPLKMDRGAYVAEMYKAIEDRWISHKDDVEAFEAELRAYGGALLDELVPPELQAALWNVRDSLTAIQVVSEEPFIPWEVVHLKPPHLPDSVPAALPAESHFLAQKGLVRWLHNHGPAARNIRIRPGRAFYVIPKYPHRDYELPAAQEEIPFLNTEMHAWPMAAEANKLRTLLGTPGAVDLLHFSGHGMTNAQTVADQTTQAQILLQGRVENDQFIPLFLDAKTVQQFGQLLGPDGNRPLVVLNACQVGRANWHLTSIGGFAEAFLRARAGAFVGTLWSVGDEPARTFTEAFYGALKGGATVVNATRAGREKAKEEGEATWLAYVVYAHPEAVVQIEDAPTSNLPPSRATQPTATI